MAVLVLAYAHRLFRADAHALPAAKAFLLVDKDGDAVLVSFAVARGAAHGQVFDGSAKACHLMALEMGEDDHGRCMGDFCGDAHRLEVLGVDGDRDFIGAEKAVGNDDRGVDYAWCKAVAQGGVEVVDGVLFDKKEHVLIKALPTFYSASYQVPEGVTAIGDYAFDACGNLTSVTLPEGLRYIGECAFNCTGLTSVKIPEGVTKIAAQAFGNTQKLTSIEIPDSVRVIGDAAFTFCLNLTSITLPKSLTYLGKNVFNEVPLTSIEIPEGVTVIHQGTFSYSHELTSITLPETLVSIEDYAFQYSHLDTITFPASLTYIDENAFYYTSLDSANVVAGSYAETWAKKHRITCVYR